MHGPTSNTRHTVFVVHGMGRPERSSTAAMLHAGFERLGDECSPRIREGYWGDYPDIERTVPDLWRRLDREDRALYARLWRQPARSMARTVLWFLRQQLRLLSPRLLREVGWLCWLSHAPIQVITPVALCAVALLRPRLVKRYLADVRLYLAPRGAIEHAIVRRIDQRVGEQFLENIGLDWDFRPVEGATPPRRVVWVAHSLGSVISYNVLADLLGRATELATSGDEEQRHGVRRFRRVLACVVTLGSPLDKVAFLFGRRVPRPWPEDNTPAWVNFHHPLDRVAGSLDASSTTRRDRPFNLRARFRLRPGFAHSGYWRDPDILGFILRRLRGRADLPVLPGAHEALPILGNRWIYPLFFVLLAGCAAPNPAAFEAYEDAAVAIERSAGRILGVDTKWTQRSAVDRLAASEGGSAAAWIVEFPPGDFDWRLEADDVLARVRRTQRALVELNAAFVEYATLLTELAAGGVEDSVQLDAAASALNARAMTAAHTIEPLGTGTDVLLFGTAGMILAREYVSHHRRRVLLDAIRRNQPSVDRFAATGRDGVRLVARDIKAEYLDHAARLVGRWPGASPSRRRSLADDLVDAGLAVVDYLDALAVLADGYGELSAMHRHLVGVAARGRLDVGELLHTATMLDIQFEKIKEASR